MDQKKIAKQMVEFNKSVFDNSFTAMTALQDQTEKLIVGFWTRQAGSLRKGKNPFMTGLPVTKKAGKNLNPPPTSAMSYASAALTWHQPCTGTRFARSPIR